MNKYQEALDNIKVVTDFYKGNIKCQKGIEIIQELVDKATPYRPKKLNLSSKVVEVDYRRCKCGLILSSGFGYCSDCGQALDWSTDE